jgi:hypothetical protein
VASCHSAIEEGIPIPLSDDGQAVAVDGEETLLVGIGPL